MGRTNVKNHSSVGEEMEKGELHVSIKVEGGRTFIEYDI